jgi:hypothetical protein
VTTALFDTVTHLDREDTVWEYVAGVDRWWVAADPARYLLAEDFAAIHPGAPSL